MESGSVGVWECGNVGNGKRETGKGQEIVTRPGQDERERKGERESLNMGWTEGGGHLSDRTSRL